MFAFFDAYIVTTVASYIMFIGLVLLRGQIVCLVYYLIS